MPRLSVTDASLQDVARVQSKDASALAAVHGSHYAGLVSQTISDRLWLAGEHLRLGDDLWDKGEYRTSISRHYYAMYHAGRALVYANVGGDEHGRHNEISSHLPLAIADRSTLQANVTDARYTRNEADYDLYPKAATDWKADAARVAANASDFIAKCETYALKVGLI